jgi:cell division protein FtsI (penicillin-binding protein 3)
MSSNSQPQSPWRLALIAIGVLLFFGAIAFKLSRIQFAEGQYWREEARREAIKAIPVRAKRGNIVSADGKLLSTSMSVYDLYWDAASVPEALFKAEVSNLAKALAKTFPTKTRGEWESYLRRAKRDDKRYLPLAKNASFSQVKAAEGFPVFNAGKYKGGLIKEENQTRRMPLGKIAERTIGYDEIKGQSGLEGAFSAFLKGRDGKRLVQKVNQGNWKPLLDAAVNEDPRNGLDLVTTLDSRIQDLAHHALLATLEKYKADHGCVVVMETKTGAIRAMANLGRNAAGNYYEKRNYAIWESSEPGSTFKLASMMVALEEGIADTGTKINTGQGVYEIYGKKIKDSNVKNGQGGYGTISLAKAFELSSNTAIAKLIYEHYKNNPGDFVDRLYRMGLNKPLGLKIQGEGKPYIPQPGQPGWSGITLAWMAYGYQISMTPLQLLTFYNGVANDGVMVRPRFVEYIGSQGKVVEQSEVVVLNPAICSKETLNKIKAVMTHVVERGTAENIHTTAYTIAGKTGTCQQNYWKQGKPDYQSSFAGFFPAEEPRYSIIVVINNPESALGYYGATVAGPVFKAISDGIYRMEAQPMPAAGADMVALRQGKPQPEINAGKALPNLQGMEAMDAVSKLENAGFHVKLEGRGKVQSQIPAAGTHPGQRATITLILG